MKTREFFLIVAIIGVLFFIFFKKKAHVPVDNDSAEIAAQVEPKTEQPLAITTSSAISGDLTAPVQPTKALTPPVNEYAAVRFSENLSAMGKCLGLANMPVPTEKVDPVPDNLVGSIRSVLGDAVVQMDDWSQVEVVEKNGTLKRIRIDYDYPDGVTPNRRLSMFTVNAYGAAEIMNLTDDETNNPNEAYIESLKEGLKVNQEQRAARLYFSQGEELVFTMKNGKLENFSFSRGNKNFTCSNMDEDSSRCTCP